jgi:hypothetical protein
LHSGEQNKSKQLASEVVGSMASNIDSKSPGAAQPESTISMVAVAEATVRSGISIHSEAVGLLKPGSVVDVLSEGVSDGHKRVQIEPGRWVSSVTARGHVLLTVVNRSNPGSVVAISVPCPPGAVAGTVLQVQHNGGLFNVAVPPGIAPGTTFQVQLPATAGGATPIEDALEFSNPMLLTGEAASSDDNNVEA